MESLVSTAIEFLKCFPLGRHCNYFVYYTENFQELLKKADDLNCVKEDVEGKINEATKRRETVYSVVSGWLQKVEKVQNQVTELNQEAENIRSCFKGGCYGRYCLGRRVFKKIGEVTELLNEGKNTGAVSHTGSRPNRDLIQVEGFEEFESTRMAKDKVLKALSGVGTNVVGVYGMGGVGKTTLMRHVGQLAKNNKLFDVVVMVPVSQNPIVQNIQDEIAENFGLKLEERVSKESRARQLLDRLKTEKNKVLIILDDLWSRLDLAEVGIPIEVGCKVVITTRRLDVCRSMKTEPDIGMDILSEEDSWHLFRKNAGASVDVALSVARDVARECKGLPIALVTLGSAMRNREQRMWQDVLEQLQKSEFEYIDDMPERVYKPLKLSYDFLRTEETKLCFLFCCLFPEDYKISIDELLKYVMGEGLLNDVGRQPEAARTLRTVMEALVASCLLIKDDKAGCFVMHDIVRDVAKIIATREKGFIVRAGGESEQWPESKMMVDCKRLSLMGSGISELPNRPECPNILTLSLSRCQTIKNIPETFFEGMPSLLSLDLSCTPIQSLPQSLTSLTNLRSLCLDGCSQLQEASLIGNLKKLEVISLVRTSIEVPDKELQEFKSIKWFVRHL